MNLHQDRDAFEGLLLDVSRRTGIRSDIVEKDYYLTRYSSADAGTDGSAAEE